MEGSAVHGITVCGGIPGLISCIIMMSCLKEWFLESVSKEMGSQFANYITIPNPPLLP